jgi:glycosyltransferase involved in cell wall biosynthesis
MVARKKESLMRIVIDMQGAQTEFSRHRGVGRYTLKLAEALVRNAGHHEILLVANGYFVDAANELRERFHGHVPDAAIQVWQQEYGFNASNLASVSLRQAAEAVRQQFIDRIRPDILISTNLQEGFGEPAVTTLRGMSRGVKLFTTLHDVIPLMEKESYLADPIVRAWYLSKVNDIRYSDVVLAVSNAAKSDIVQLLGVDPDRIHVVPNGVDTEKFYPKELTRERRSNLLNAYGIEAQFCLYVGGNDYHKNLGRLYQAYALASERVGRNNMPQLLLIGKEIFNERDSVSKSLKEADIEEHVVIAGRVPDEDLVDLLNIASFFVYPSLYEGFGLPVLEAMACGTAVIGSATPSVAEVINYAGALFDPLDVNEIAEKLYEVIADENFKLRLKDHGLARAKHYSWDKSACNLLSLIECYDRGSPNSNGPDLDAIKVKSLNASDQILVAPYVHAIAERIASCQFTDAELRVIAKSIAESFPPIKRDRSRLFLDVSAVVVNGARTGIQRVVRAISAELLKAFDEETLQLVYATPDNLNFRRASNIEGEWVNRIIVDSGAIVEFYPGDVLLFLDLHPGLAINHEARTRRMRARGIKIFHIVYDLLPALKSNFFWPELCSEFVQWLKVIVQSSGVVCISKTVAEEFRAWALSNTVLRSDFQVSWFHLGADIASSVPSVGIPEEAEQILKSLEAKRSFLIVGTIEPRKGHGQALAAFDALWARGSNARLVIIGKIGWGMEDFGNRLVTHPELGRRLFWLQSASDEYLEKIYHCVACLLVPSEGEGFGLPLIEAARLGLPIIARDLPVFREVAEDGAHYFNAEDGAELAAALQIWLERYEAGLVPLSTSIKYLTWSQSAAQLLTAIGFDRSPMVASRDTPPAPQLSQASRKRTASAGGMINEAGHNAATESYQAGTTD